MFQQLGWQSWVRKVANNERHCSGRSGDINLKTMPPAGLSPHTFQLETENTVGYLRAIYAMFSGTACPNPPDRRSIFQRNGLAAQKPKTRMSHICALR
jgi:hypothetical protein